MAPKKRNTIELLAPARNLESGKIAINCGADAVYIGGPQFGARSDAHNSVTDIAALIEYAHRYCCKVYVAMNTLLLNDDEVHAAAKLIRALHDAGADGAIIQDLGLLEAGLPPLPIIASTQMHNHNSERVRFLEGIGFHRAILARELQIDEIAAIRKATENIELEAFVHGALCMSYSGQCYLSAAIGGRSANRGECAQPCRKKYVLKSGAGNIVAKGHLLSVKDLCRIQMLDAMMAAGVTSFKIEGRLKNDAYVANVVTAYRIALDKVLSQRGLPVSGDVYSHRINPNLNKTFHRGYVSHFAKRNEKIANFATPKMTGEKIGQVRRVRKNEIQIHTAADTTLFPGDGICFFSGDTLKGTRIQKIVSNGIILLDSSDIQEGTEIYRNRDHQFLSALEKQAPGRQSPIRIAVTLLADRITLDATDASLLNASTTLDGPFEPARNRNNMLSTLKRQLGKSGDTEFTVADIDVHCDEVPFLQIATINELRRAVLLQLRHRRALYMKTLRQKCATSIGPFPCSDSIDKYQNVANSFARRFLRKCGAATIAKSVDETGNYQAAEVMRSRYCLRRELGICGADTTQNNLYLEDPALPQTKLPLRFDCEKCEMAVHYENKTQSKN